MLYEALRLGFFIIYSLYDAFDGVMNDSSSYAFSKRLVEEGPFSLANYLNSRFRRIGGFIFLHVLVRCSKKAFSNIFRAESIVLCTSTCDSPTSLSSETVMSCPSLSFIWTSTSSFSLLEEDRGLLTML